MSEQQKSTPAESSKGRRSRAEADSTPPESTDSALTTTAESADTAPSSDSGVVVGGASNPHLHFAATEKERDGVELYRGEDEDRVTVTAYKPSTITRLKSEGWTPVEEESA